jgi:hypothetical protein
MIGPGCQTKLSLHSSNLPVRGRGFLDYEGFLFPCLIPNSKSSQLIAPNLNFEDRFI